MVAAALLGSASLASQGTRRWLDAPRLGLALLMLLDLPRFYGRVGGDGYEYFTLARTLVFDFDLDVRNDFAGLGVVTMRDPSGDPMSRFPLGLPLLWAPALLLTRIASWLAAAAGLPVETAGFGPQFQAAATGTSFVFALACLAVTEHLVRARYGRATSALCVGSLWLATPLWFYAVANPFMSHTASALLAALLVWAWLRVRQRAPTQGASEEFRAWLGLGALGAFMGLVRVQDGAFLALPALDALFRRGGARWRLVAALVVPAVLVVLLQVVVWRVMHGPAFFEVARQGHLLGTPFHTVDVLFSARHGLFTWTPLYAAALLGLLELARRSPRLGLISLAMVFLCAAVNSRMTDWWGGDAFGQRRLLGLTVLFGLGLAESIEAASRRPKALIAALLLVLALWNQQLTSIYNSEIITGKSQAVSLDRLAPAQVDLMARRLLAAADWLPRRVFALAYDNLRGVWLDEGARSLRGRIDLGRESEDFPVIGHGWATPQAEPGVDFRRANVARAWLRLPILSPGDFAIVVRARAELTEVPVTLALETDGISLGRALLNAEWSEHRFSWPRERVHVGINDLALRGSPTPVEVVPGFRGRNSAFAVDWVKFERVPPPPGARRGGP